MRRKILIALGVLIGIVVLAVTVGLLYVLYGDLSRHKGIVEDLVSDATPDFGLYLGVHVGGGR